MGNDQWTFHHFYYILYIYVKDFGPHDGLDPDRHSGRLGLESACIPEAAYTGEDEDRPCHTPALGGRSQEV